MIVTLVAATIIDKIGEFPCSHHVNLSKPHYYDEQPNTLVVVIIDEIEGIFLFTSYEFIQITLS